MNNANFFQSCGPSARRRPPIVLSNLPTGFEQKPHTWCGICGAIFHHDDIEVRRAWSFKHADGHSEREHKLLALSGHSMTPEAALRLAPYGIVDVTAATTSQEHEQAYLESKPVPTQGTGF